MVTLNLRDGSTLKLDLAIEQDRVRFNSLGRAVSGKDNSQAVTGFWLSTKDQPAFTLPIPKKFTKIDFYAEYLIDRSTNEKRGEVIRIQADDVCLVATRYYKENSMIRFDLIHTGKPRFSPHGGANV